MNVVLSGLAKGVLMLVLAAAFTWALIAGFERRAMDDVSARTSDVVPKIAHVPGKQRTNAQWQF